VPTFTHFMDLPILMLIVSLGAFRPDTWTQVVSRRWWKLARRRSGTACWSGSGGEVKVAG
jgi:hypothetical protein